MNCGKRLTRSRKRQPCSAWVLRLVIAIDGQPRSPFKRWSDGTLSICVLCATIPPRRNPEDVGSGARLKSRSCVTAFIIRCA